MNNKNQPGGFFDRMWDFFTSVKLSVALLLTLAVTSIIGTVLPQNMDPRLYEKFGPMLYTLIDIFRLSDMYHSWWFRLLILMLMVNIIVCSIERLSATWKIIFPKKPLFRVDRFLKSTSRAEWESEHSPEVLKSMISGYMEKRYCNSRVEPYDGGYLIFGEKGRWTRLGVYVVHLSIVLLMIGGLIGSIFGFEGYMNLPVGGSGNTIASQDGTPIRRLGFDIRCDDFTVNFYPSGMPKEYRSRLAIIDKGQVVLEKDLRVNEPIHYGGVSIFQSSYGRVPGKTFSVVFTDNASGLRIEKRASIGDRVELPAGGGTFAIEDFTNDFGFRGHSLGPSFIGLLIPRSGIPEPVVIPIEFPGFDRMRGGEYTISIENIDYGYSTGLQITRDPGVMLVYAGFAAMILGCCITFFMLHRQFCIWLAHTGQQSKITVYGISPKNRPGIKAAVNRLSGKLRHLARHTNH